MRPMGFSTGALALGDFRRALQMLADKNTSAVELSALRYRELSELLRRLDSLDLSTFSYIAIHAPTDAPNERELVKALLAPAGRGINIVVHPDSIKDVAAWAQLDGHLCIENMDSRKRTGRTAGELRQFFRALPAAKLCFDIGHARQVDPTMTEAVHILNEFGNRLAHLHVSEVDSQGAHHEVSFAASRAFREIADRIDPETPVIIEAIVSESAIRQELNVATKAMTPIEVAAGGP